MCAGGFVVTHSGQMCGDACPLPAAMLQIHQLNSTWSEARKASYVRHAVREYTIHKALHHRNIVSLTDIFEVCAARDKRARDTASHCVGTM